MMKDEPAAGAMPYTVINDDVTSSSQTIAKPIVTRSKIVVGDRVIVEKGNRSTYTVQHIKGSVVWFEETNDSCFVDECTKVE